MQQVDWTRLKLPAFEMGKDGFPRPGRVTKYYRERKKLTDATWTQQRVARELGITVKAVSDSENRDAGFDSMALRRKVARWFDIPPLLLGLASLEEEPELGQLIRRYRKMKEKGNPLRFQVGLARALGITEMAVRRMEKQNTGLDSITRRRMLAHLLDIPPAALGIVTLEEILSKHQTILSAPITTSPARKVALDLTAYKNRLKTIYNHFHYSTEQNLLVQIGADMASLDAVLPYASGSDEAEIRSMLCRYHQLHAHILRDQGRYDTAIEELEKAVILAERAGNSLQLVATLLRLGHVLHDRGDVALAQSRIETARGNSTGANHMLTLAHADYTTAAHHYSRARHIEQLPPALNGMVLLGEGHTQLRLAHGQRDAIRAALTNIEQGGRFIARTKDILEDEFLKSVSERSYHSSKAAALLAAGWPREAMQELSDLMDLPPEGDMTRMNAYTSYLWSQAYADLGWVDAAAAPAQDSLAVMKKIKSNVNIARLAGLQAQLSQIDDKNIEVIRLGVMLNS
jgi:transcriptional regulator with XRE-family HTH domain